MAIAGPRRARNRVGGWLAPALLALVVLVAMIAVGGLLPSLRNPFGTETRDRSGPAVLKSLEDLSEYRAATANLEVIVDVEEDARNVPSFIKGERTLFVAAGSVDAVVDFGRLGRGAVRVSDDRRAVTITLPPARLSRARVDPRRSRVVDRQRGLVDRAGGIFSDNPTSERELYLLAEDKLAAAARDPAAGLLQRAEQNMRATLTSLMRSLGFRRVSVRFTRPGAQTDSGAAPAR